MSLIIQESRKVSGFTLVELMVTIAILATLTAVALPNFDDFIRKTKVDNEISELHRLLLTARNTAINTDQNVTICAIGTGSKCTGGSNWKNEIVVFIDTNANSTLDAGEEVIRRKEAADSSDKMEFTSASIIYTPSGRTTVDTSGTFKYCPNEHVDDSRGIEISASGRVYATTDHNKDGKDQTRDGSNFTCTL